MVGLLYKDGKEYRNQYYNNEKESNGGDIEMNKLKMRITELKNSIHQHVCIYLVAMCICYAV